MSHDLPTMSCDGRATSYDGRGFTLRFIFDMFIYLLREYILRSTSVANPSYPGLEWSKIVMGQLTAGYD